MSNTTSDRRAEPPASLAQSINTAGNRTISPVTARALREFQATLPPSAARERNLERLSAPGAVAVITGQQAGLYLGPLLTLYKTLTAIKAAEQIEATYNVPAVPVFWLQVEDHDYEEVRSAGFHSREGKRIDLSLPEAPSSERRPLAYIGLPEEIDALNTQLHELLGMYPGSDEILSAVQAAYRPGISMADAFARLMAALTESYGLLFFNPRHPQAIAAASPVIHRAVSEYQTISELLLQQTKELEQQGLATPVHVRADAPLPFIHPDGAEQNRYRFAAEGDVWRLIGTERTLSKAEVENLLTDSPECFSGSALLRPIVQDSLFPTAAYVGGPAEVAYFKQITPLFEFFDLPQPTVLPRAAFRLLETRTVKWLKDLEISASDLKLPEEELAAKVLRRNSSTGSPEVLRSEAQGRFNELISFLEDPFAAVDKNLLTSLRKAEEKMGGILSSTLDRYTKAAAQSDSIAGERLDKLTTLLFPQGQEQERVYSPIDFLVRTEQPLVQEIYAAIEPFRPSLKELAI